MRIENVTTQTCDLEGRAALLLHEDARMSREQQTEARRAAQLDQVQRLRQAAAQLRRMAASTLASGILQGVCSLVSAAGKESWVGRSARVLGSFDAFRWLEAYQQVEKQTLDADAQAAAARVDDRRAGEDEARRVQQSAAQELARIVEGRHRVAMAAQRA